MTYHYQSEKFSDARRALMLPHSKGEAVAIAAAFHEIHLAMHRFDRAVISDDNALSWLRTLDRLMDTAGLEDPGDQGLWSLKGAALTVDDKLELSQVVDELAHWFRDQTRF